ncbi:predicted protein [Chaetomium globosum CBS 148.51]|uniref:Uncharacterized protein n=1 Tax=Chaetomium globosum (strain ATCC 6205 / CBS 148.51 / DSM 1962 / NBRC 6347 / NRRL 1970) TaxID=306901 RepID=Q2GRQ4_CHAGB|nr:uncharacterized protein CHGG_09350 [Chaetomium globosum CBS 148.51]EAQ85336.1 predicted protein [Chaetomium globosum CBS 148.51]
MHPKLHSIATSLLLATQAQAFRVTFYLGSQCRGARLGTGSYSYPGYPNACHNVPPNAISATIEPEYLDGESNNVAFWKSCSQDLIASGDDNCLNFPKATRFSIREDWTVPGKRSVPSAATTSTTESEKAIAPLAQKTRARGRSRTAAHAPWAAEQARHRQRLNVSEAAALGSLSPYFDPAIMAEGGFGHGNVSEAFGDTVRWQQVALGISVGVPIHEWDDAVHVKSDAFVPYGDVHSRGLEARDDGCGGAAAPDEEGVCHSHWALAERSEHEKRWDYARCRSLLTCVRDTVGGAPLRLADGWAQGVECANRIKAAGSTLYDYVKRYPVTCEVVKLGAGGRDRLRVRSDRFRWRVLRLKTPTS